MSTASELKTYDLTFRKSEEDTFQPSGRPGPVFPILGLSGSAKEEAYIERMIRRDREYETRGQL